MINLQTQADFFVASIKLTETCTGISNLIAGQPLEERMQEAFIFADDLTEQLYNLSPNYKKTDDSKLNILVINLRPKFYESLAEQKIPFDTKFYERLNETLKFKGEQTNLTRKELEQAHSLYEALAKHSLHLSTFNW